MLFGFSANIKFHIIPVLSALNSHFSNTIVEQYYREYNNSVYAGYYYLNNFSNILVSGVTLFELTVVNNWFIIMEGYASVVGEWTRLFFMLFYLVMLVVLAIVVAFIIEAFTFRNTYNDAFEPNENAIDGRH